MNDETAKGSSEIDTRFMIIAGSLMLLIIALLAGLWLRMRVRAIRAESELAQLRPMVRNKQDVKMLLAESLRRNPIHITVQRDSLKTEQVNINGLDVKALRLPANAAEIIGFRPGDVIIVEKTPPTTTAPTTTQYR